MAQLKSCKNSLSIAESECKKEVACNVFKDYKCQEVRTDCEEILRKQLNDNCQSELKKIEERCESEVRQKFDEKKQGIDNIVKAMFPTCTKEQFELAPKACKEKEKGMDEARENLELIYSKEMGDKLVKCKHEDRDGDGYVKLGEHGKLRLKEAVKAFYPELSDDIISKVNNGTYFIRQFGLNVNDVDNGGPNPGIKAMVKQLGGLSGLLKNLDSITWTGNTDKSCINVGDQSYKIWDNPSGSFNPKCTNQFLDNVERYNTTYKDYDQAHIQIVKVAKKYSDVERCKPVVTISQMEPLIIANVANVKLVTRDGTVTNVTHYGYKQFADANGRILDFTGKGADCKVCQDSVWDFQGEIPVYADGCTLF